ncbi:ABC transporter substrate-binding protein [Allokutzneria albata]|uniref:NitT/TauT family transport system substrate-binding protein n=1 Tax=Allokutzneria albata TaxID=211114 RepID=A0A1G9R1I7_ALLAB|nr:ABC transporter substrate-binding protein [Allokutzneria albata]SDM17109.1 NitT/TauT family transport system substrate-binding protein [Allokutzneria albata]
MRALLAALSLLLVASGCGLLGGDSGADAAGGAGLEKSRIKIGAMPIIDFAPLHMAIQKGYFRDEGLEIETVGIPGGTTSVNGLVGKQFDISVGNWMSFFEAQSKGVADLKLIADGYQARPHNFVIVVPQGSSITAPQHLAGKRIAVTIRGAIAELLAKASMDAHSVDHSGVGWVEIQFPAMPAALKNKQVDAAVMVEPFITQAERNFGALPVLDVAQGATGDFPISGYATTAAFARDNPKTITAFRRALQRAQKEASDRGKVEQVLPSFAKGIDQVTASLVHLGAFPTRLDTVRIQRVADLMTVHGLLPKPLKVDGMVMENLPDN